MAFRLRGPDGDAKAPPLASAPAVFKRVRREMSFMSFLAFAADDTVARRQPAWIVSPRGECHPARQELSSERSNRGRRRIPAAPNALAPPIPTRVTIEDPFMIRASGILLRPIGFALFTLSTALAGGNNYQNFDVALYSRVYETRQMNDPPGSKTTGKPYRNT